MPRTSAGRNTFLVSLGTLTVPAQVDAAQPAGLIDGNAASLSLDTGGNLRTTLTAAGLPAGTGLPVVNLGGIADTLLATGTVTTPGAGAAIATLAIPGAGTYNVLVIAGYGGTAGAVNDMVFKNNGTNVGTALFVLPSTNVQTPTPLVRITATGAINFTVNAIAGGAGVYIASISAVRVS